MSHLIRSNIQAMDGYVPGEQTQNPNILKLNTNENPYPPSPRVKAALATFNTDSLRKYPNPSGSALRERIAELHNCRKENVIVCNGSDEGLALCVRAFVEATGNITYFDPSYSLYPVLADMVGVPRNPIALTDAFEMPEKVPLNVPLFFVTNPNAPTGMLHPRDKIISLCESSSGVVVLDEAYVDFADTHCADLPLRFPNVLIARTLSKSYSLAGLRLGYLIGHADLIGAMDKVKDSYNLDAITQALGLAALSDQAYMKQCSARVIQTRESLTQALRTLGFQVYPSHANFVWIRPPRKTAKELFDYLKQRDILTRHFDSARTRDFVRITIGTDADMARLLDVTKGFFA